MYVLFFFNLTSITFTVDVLFIIVCELCSPCILPCNKNEEKQNITNNYRNLFQSHKVAFWSLIRYRVKPSLTEDFCIWLQTGNNLIPYLTDIYMCHKQRDKRIKTLHKILIKKIIFSGRIGKSLFLMFFLSVHKWALEECLQKWEFDL